MVGGRNVDGAAASEAKALPEGVEAFEAFGADEIKGFSAVSAFSEPKAIGGATAFRPFGSVKKQKAVPGAEQYQNEAVEPVSENRKALEADTDLTETVPSVNEDSDEPVTDVLQPVTSSEADTVDAEETPDELSEKEESLQNDSCEDAECDDSQEGNPEAEENADENSAQTSAEISEKEAVVGETISSEPAEPNIKSPPTFTKILHQAACRSGGANDGSIEITMEEMQLLLADPEFWEYEAKFAEMIQKNLPSADDSSE